MSVSTVAPPPIAIVVPSYDTTKQQDDQKTKDNDPTYKPPPPAPLPPGQGTRIDQLAGSGPVKDETPDPVDRAFRVSGRTFAG